MSEVIDIARGASIPTIVDAAYLNYPVRRMSSFTEAGADLVCFSAKYFGGPNAGGFICGRRDLMDAVAAVDFTGFESGRYCVFGRPFKLDRQTIVAVVVALQEWFETDHDARFAEYRRKVEALSRELHGLDAIQLTPMNFTMAETLEPEPINCLHVRVGPDGRRTAEQIDDALRAGDPGVLVHCLDGALVVVVETLRDGDEHVIAGRLKRALA
jgi:seryl-tRNA(Sec) selenium transferase